MSQFSSSAKILTSSDGTKIYADASGSPDKPSIVFVHGQGLSSAVFDNIFFNKQYTEELYLVRYDMRGHGRSDKPDTMDGHASKLYADDFAAVMKAFNLRKPVLVGWSLGATVSADIASHLPKSTLAGIVYLSALPFVGPILQKVATPEVLALLPPLFADDSVSQLVTASSTFIDLLFLDASKVSWELRTLWIGMCARQRPIHRELAVTRPQDPSGLYELGMQGVPMLVIGGVHDRQIMNQNVADEMRPYFKDLELCLIEKGGSHTVFIENHEEFMRKVMEFTRRAKAE